MDVAVDKFPDKFYLQTTLLPRPQFPVRLSEKNYKTATNYKRREGTVLYKIINNKIKKKINIKLNGTRTRNESFLKP